MKRNRTDYMRDYYARNRERISKRRKALRGEHTRAYERAYRERNRERMRELWRAQKRGKPCWKQSVVRVPVPGWGYAKAFAALPVRTTG